MNVARAGRGQIVFLNGTSSSGKTSIAAQLMMLLRRPYFHLAADSFNGMRSVTATSELPPGDVAEVLERTVLGFHRAVAGMASAGNDVVVDHVLREPHWFTDCLAQWEDFDVVFVGVRCSLAELTRRERVRDEGEIGRAAHQFDRVHAHGEYDVECDTEAQHARDCAMQIKDFLASSNPADQPRAFDRLRAARLLVDAPSG
ncbi:MAG TPA: AAA family ATPase [Pseudonocardiaceae bacterium]|nr:AAA family ATPase [Pseudonocardiaceae bacterium]